MVERRILLDKQRSRLKTSYDTDGRLYRNCIPVTEGFIVPSILAKIQSRNASVQCQIFRP